jgi:hypothetical protein
MESIGFTCKKKIIANFHFLGLFILKSGITAKKKSVCHAALLAVLDEIWGADSSAVLSARMLKFRLPASFKPIWCTSYLELSNSIQFKIGLLRTLIT